MEKMKRLALVLTVISLLIGAQCGYAEPDSPEDGALRYSLINQITASLSISNTGSATCIGKLTAKKSGDKCNVTTKLMRKVSGTWKLVDSWSNSGASAYGVMAKGSCRVDEGTYKLIVTGTVTAADGTKETAKRESPVKTF